jgi:hypothetical protein
VPLRFWESIFFFLKAQTKTLEWNLFQAINLLPFQPDITCQIMTAGLINPFKHELRVMWDMYTSMTKQRSLESSRNSDPKTRRLETSADSLWEPQLLKVSNKLIPTSQKTLLLHYRNKFFFRFENYARHIPAKLGLCSKNLK